MENNYKIEKVNYTKIKNKFLDFYPYILEDKIFKKLINSYEYIGYTINKNNKTIATLMFKEDLEFPYIWQLSRIKVDYKYKKKGIGSKLLNKILDFIKKENGYKVLVYVSDSNKIAQAFYKKNGFKKEATIKNMKLKKENLNIFSKVL